MSVLIKSLLCVWNLCKVEYNNDKWPHNFMTSWLHYRSMFVKVSMVIGSYIFFIKMQVLYNWKFWNCFFFNFNMYPKLWLFIEFGMYYCFYATGHHPLLTVITHFLVFLVCWSYLGPQKGSNIEPTQNLVHELYTTSIDCWLIQHIQRHFQHI